MSLQTVLALSAALASAAYLLRDLLPGRRRQAGCGGCATGSCPVPRLAKESVPLARP